ncbi:amidohydrolase/deacetylase family metallohydrolase [Clostridium sp. MSJ-4]|uniref:Amidohydrolase/deacetylase family metallohydrolase n=1 Tax=Clostridium simiarum TaxID=2841506 RepID=A0ABS6F1Z0_9CLOT|nr:amidohydrolase/deacetylase family metallohydrolase [Clostridium simiarum]MBU5591894.1 amidohydrolase/deacetylase family metallohydrolase [Clostridium simiarum]
MYDLLLKKAKLVSGEIYDIAIHNGTILDIDKNINTNDFKKIIELKDNQYVSAGWIDLHTHSYTGLKLYSDNPDEIGLKSGVTTVVDTGTAGALNIEDFYNLSKQYKTNVYAFLNISKTGIVQQNELSDLSNIDLKLIKSSIEKYPDFIIGLKARMSKSVVGDNGILPLKLALEAKDQNDHMPLMVHIGTKPPQIEGILSLLGEDDILTHCYHGKENGLFDKEGIPKEELLKALDRGLHLDVGHGKESFSFKVAGQGRSAKIYPHSISTDIYFRNRIHGPVFNMATTLSKFLYLGYSLEEIIPLVTINPAKAINLTKKGRLEKDMDADITIFTLYDEEIELVDSLGTVVKGNKKVMPLAVVLNGEYIDLKEVEL